MTPTTLIVRNGKGGFIETMNARAAGYDFNGYNLFNCGTWTPFEVVELDPRDLPKNAQGEPVTEGLFCTESGRYYKEI